MPGRGLEGFGPVSSPLNENTSDEELLDMLDNTLRNGIHATRANLVFDLLCSRLGFDRHQLPGYVADMKKLEEATADLEEKRKTNPYYGYGGQRP